MIEEMCGHIASLRRPSSRGRRPRLWIRGLRYDIGRDVIPSKMPHLDPTVVPEMSKHTARNVIKSLAEACRTSIRERATGVVGATALALGAYHIGSEGLRRRWRIGTIGQSACGARVQGVLVGFLIINSFRDIDLLLTKINCLQPRVVVVVGTYATLWPVGTYRPPVGKLEKREGP
jgi:hypothetical protein